MIVIKFLEGSHHFDSIQKLLKLRNMPFELGYQLPELTVIAFEDEMQTDPIAVGSLRKVEGQFGMFDGFMTDPTKSSESRKWAIQEIITELLQMASYFRIHKLFALTNEENFIHRGYQEGFSYVPLKVIMKNEHC